jgi:hypothetical protein
VVLIVRRMILPAQAFHSALLLHPVYLFGLALVALCAGSLLIAKVCDRALAPVAGRWVLALASLVASLWVGERVLRHVLEQQIGAGTFEQFKSMKARGQNMPVTSASPLAKIITPCDHPELLYVLEPNLDIEFGHRRLMINGAGMRSTREFSVEKPLGVVRILGLGDSGMFGWGVEQDEPYLAVMEKSLREQFPGREFEVMNTGTPGYNTHQELEWLKLHGLAYKPDVVIVGWCENDFFLPHFFLEKSNLPKDRFLLLDLAFDRERFRDEISGVRIRDRETARKNEAGKVDLDTVGEESLKGTGAEGVVASLREMQELSRQHGFRLLVFGPMKPDILEIVQELGLDYLNTREKIRAGQYPAEWELHAMHPRAEGHAVLGRVLARELMDRQWIKAGVVVNGSVDSHG